MKPLASSSPPRRSLGPRLVIAVVLVAGVYLLLAYLVAPLIWVRYAHRHPALDSIPNITYTSDDHPGDPINIALVGSEDDVKRSLIKAGWYPADPITLKSCLEIAAGTVLKRPYDDAPVSALFFEKRKQDFAFEQPVGNDPRKRHHVRFWRSQKLDDQGRPLWSGGATYDERVGLSHTTGEITHHISGDVDAERDHLLETLQQAGVVARLDWIDDFHQVREGINGGGDRWHTDGRLAVVELAP
jgi:hypothetical protein